VQMAYQQGGDEIDKVVKFRRGYDSQTVVEFDVPRNTYLLTLDVPKYKCSMSDFIDVLSDLNRTITETLADAPPGPPAPAPGRTYSFPLPPPPPPPPPEERSSPVAQEVHHHVVLSLDYCCCSEAFIAHGSREFRFWFWQSVTLRCCKTIPLSSLLSFSSFPFCGEERRSFLLVHRTGGRQ